VILNLVGAEQVAGLIESGDIDGLRSVTDIDGAAVDIAAMLDATGSELDRRLETLAGLLDRGSLVGTDPSSAADTARRILEGSKYEVAGEGFLDRIGAILLAWLDRFLNWLSSALGGPANTALVVIGVVVLVGLVGFTFLARRRSATLDQELSLERLLAEGGDPSEYEQSAEIAAEAGSFDAALRYRFLAGLLRLDLSGRITFRPGLTTGEISDTLSDARFDHLMDVFNDVAYGGRHADAATYAESVATWMDLLTPDPARR
jgi:hypothetical protein